MKRILCFSLVAALAGGGLAMAQQSGSIDGTVRDEQGLVMPGVTVTLSGAAVLGQQVATTVTDGTYRFRDLRPGSYNIRYELSGFQTLNREGIIVETGKLVTVNIALAVATVAETVTVTGESPVVDVKNTRVGGTFDVTALQEVPSATDVWAVLGQTPGIRMLGFDVGGSHKSQQTGYESFGVRGQARILSDGVDSTEGTGGTGFYYDYYSVEEFQVSAGGADVTMNSPGAAVVMTLKSGGNQFSGLYNLDYEGKSMVGDNKDAQTEARGYTGNPVLLFWEGHADIGGPIMKDKMWFYGTYNHFKINKAISGVSQDLSTDLGIFNNFGGKVTFQATKKDEIILYSQWGRKQKPNRGLSLTRPPESILAQDSWSWDHKAEWQRVWNDRTFTNVQAKHFGFVWPMVPAVDPATNPARRDTATGIYSGAGYQSPTVPPFTFPRWKPQFTVTTNYYLPAKSGSHDFKVGFEYWIDSSRLNYNSNSGDIFYLDNSALGHPHNVDEINFMSTPLSTVDNRDTHTDFFAQDTWTITNRVTVNAGFRFGRQVAGYQEGTLNPNLTFSDPRTGQPIFSGGTTPGATLATWNTIAPRLGITFDLQGNGKTVLKGYFGRYYTNIADLLGVGNPAALQWKRFKFLDQNQNGVFDGPQELGDFVRESGAGGAPPVTNFDPAYADEFSASVEHEIAPDTGFRFSYVRKQLRNALQSSTTFFPLQSQAIALAQGQGVPCGDAAFPCPINATTGQPLNLLRLPDNFVDQGGVIANNPAPYDKMKYDTIDFSVNRRFSKDFFVQGSMDYQWRDEVRLPTQETTSPLSADPIQVAFGQNHNADVSLRQKTTTWQFKLLGRYELPHDIGLSGNIRITSGWPWAPIQSVAVPGSGTQDIFTTDLTERSQTVPIVDFRAEKGFSLGGHQKVSAMVDFYNIFNSNAETNFIVRTGSAFQNLIAVLDPRTVKIGIRYQF
jgi:Carboxypeptidase regulatory-like domain